MEWVEHHLGDLVRFKHGWAFKSKHFDDQDNGRPVVVSIGNFDYSGGFRFESTAIKQYTGSFPQEYLLSPGDILLVMTCQTAGGEILGIPGRIPDDGQRYLHNQRMAKLVTLAPEIVDEAFLYYLFLSPGFNRHLVTQASGTKILHTAPSRMESYRFKLPSLIEQQAIAEILGALDDKIELNRKMNATLDELARTIFRSWFVDFDPVHAKTQGRTPFGMDAETAALFPDRFAASLLGPMPEGWELHKLGEVAKFAKGRSYRKAELQNSTTALVTLKSFQRGGGYREDGLKPYTGLFSDNQIVAPGELVLALTDVTQSADIIGQPAIVLPNPGFDTLVASLDVAAVRPANGTTIEYLYGLAGSSRFNDYARGQTTGTTVLHLSTRDIENFPVAVPPRPLMAAFSVAVRPLLELFAENSLESRTIAELRNTLLPELISGRIRVREVEQPVAEVV